MVNLQTQLKSEVGLLAEYISDELSVFIVAENKPDDRPANGGLRLLNYETDMEWSSGRVQTCESYEE